MDFLAAGRDPHPFHGQNYAGYHLFRTGTHSCGHHLFSLLVCVNKKLAYQLGFTYFSAGLTVQTLNFFFGFPRPWVLDPSFHAVESAVPDATGYSFPSGHTQGLFFFFPLFTWTRKKWLKVCVFLRPYAWAFPRMYLGCHTPKDVLASLGVSALFAHG